jgi:hypothetical protein
MVDHGAKRLMIGKAVWFSLTSITAQGHVKALRRSSLALRKEKCHISFEQMRSERNQWADV